MSDDDSDKSANKSWLERLSYALLGEPQDQEQLVNLLRDASEKEILNHDALRMMEGVLHISEMQVEDVMIPKQEMITVSEEQSLADILPIITESQHSRFPVIGDSKNEVIGILLAKDLLSFVNNKPESEFDIHDLLRPAVFIPQSKRLDILLNDFRKKRNHLAIVVDEYGNISGMVTIEDVLEQIVGDIEDEYDIDEQEYIRKHNEANYSIQATCPIEDFNDYFHTQLENQECDTIGGLVLAALGHLPKAGEQITIENIPFTVLKATNRRIVLLKTSFSPLAEANND